MPQLAETPISHDCLTATDLKAAFLANPYVDGGPVHAAAYAVERGLVVTDNSIYTGAQSSDADAIARTVAEQLAAVTLHDDPDIRADIDLTGYGTDTPIDAAIAVVQPGHLEYSVWGEPELFIIKNPGVPNSTMEGSVRRLPKRDRFTADRIGLQQELLADDDAMVVAIAGPLAAHPDVTTSIEDMLLLTTQGINQGEFRTDDRTLRALTQALDTANRLLHTRLQADHPTTPDEAPYTNPATAIIALPKINLKEQAFGLSQ